MPLILGDWYINANGHEGELHIETVDPQGNLTGTVYGQEIFGFWDETSQKITFMRKTIPADPSTFQIYTGYLFSTRVGTVTTHTLAGYFEAFKGTGGAAQRSLYGWVASTSETYNP